MKVGVRFTKVALVYFLFSNTAFATEDKLEAELSEGLVTKLTKYQAELKQAEAAHCATLYAREEVYSSVIPEVPEAVEQTISKDLVDREIRELGLGRPFIPTTVFELRVYHESLYRSGLVLSSIQAALGSKFTEFGALHSDEISNLIFKTETAMLYVLDPIQARSKRNLNKLTGMLGLWDTDAVSAYLGLLSREAALGYPSLRYVILDTLVNFDELNGHWIKKQKTFAAAIANARALQKFRPEKPTLYVPRNYRVRGYPLDTRGRFKPRLFPLPDLALDVSSETQQENWRDAIEREGSNGGPIDNVPNSSTKYHKLLFGGGLNATRVFSPFYSLTRSATSFILESQLDRLPLGVVAHLLFEGYLDEDENYFEPELKEKLIRRYDSLIEQYETLAQAIGQRDSPFYSANPGYRPNYRRKSKGGNIKF